MLKERHKYDMSGFPICFETLAGHKYHESVLRSYQILEQVKGLLELGTPQSVILDIISVMESSYGKDLEEK